MEEVGMAGVLAYVGLGFGGWPAVVLLDFLDGWGTSLVDDSLFI